MPKNQLLKISTVSHAYFCFITTTAFILLKISYKKVA